MVTDKYTTTSRSATEYDLDKVIFANHATVPVVITIPHDQYLGIKDDRATPVVAIEQKGDAAVSFVAGDKVTLVGTVPTPAKDGKPIAVMRHGVSGSNVVWGYL